MRNNFFQKDMLVKKGKQLQLDQNYLHFLDSIKDRLKTSQIRAALAANCELLKFYWTLGADLIEKQKTFKWGDGFLEQFSHDVKQAFPEMQGFSPTNLKRMRIFAKEYPEFGKSPQTVDQLPWGHIATLLHKIKNSWQREWYAREVIANGWSRTVLELQIESNLFDRQGMPEKKVTNYGQQLPPAQSDLVTNILKDPYRFDFLTIQGKAKERDIEKALIAHIKNFLLELGQGFAFVGSQVSLTFDDQEFFYRFAFLSSEIKSIHSY